MNTLVSTALANLSFLMIGCVVPFQVVSPEYLASDSTSDIRITTNDGSIIVMKSGDYSVSKAPDTLKITGKGRRIAGSGRYTESSFDGTLSRDQIAKLELADSGIPPVIRYPLYLLGAMSVVCLAFAVWLGISLHGRGFGG